MGKKIKISEEQAKRILGLDETAIYGWELPGSSRIGNSEVHAESPITDKLDHAHFSHVEPFTSMDFDDDIATKGTLDGRLGYSRAIGYTVCENKKKLQEDNSNLKQNRFYIPDQLMQNLQNNLQRLGDKAPKRLLSLTNTGDRGLSYKEMYRLKGVFDGTDKKYQGNIQDIGGLDMKNWVDQQLKTATSNDKTRRDIDQQLLGKPKLNRPSTKGTGKQHTKGGFQPEITYEN